MTRNCPPKPEPSFPHVPHGFSPHGPHVGEGETLAVDHIADTLIPDTQVATILGVSVASLRRWRAEHRGPKWIRVEGQIRYRLQDIHDYLAARTEPRPADRRPQVEQVAVAGGSKSLTEGGR